MNRIFKNTSVLFGAHFIGRLGALVITISLMPRYFTEHELGGFFVAIALTNLIACLTELGIDNPLVREMTLKLSDTRHYLGNALLVRLVLSIVAFTLMILSAMVLGYEAVVLTMILYLGLAEIVNSIAQLFRSVFRAHEEMKYEAWTVVAERGTYVLVGGAAILLGYGIISVCQVMLIASGINLILSIGYTRYRFTPLGFNPSRKIVITIMQQALPFAVGNLFNLLYFRIDAIMLSKLSPDGLDANTWYGLSYSIVNALTTLPGAFMMGAMFPILSRLYVNEPERLSQAYTFGVRWMVICAVPLAVGLAVISHELTAVLFPKYTSDVLNKIGTVLQWLSATGGMVFLTTVVFAVLRAADKRAVFSVIMGTTALLNISLNFFLIPRYSHIGAAIALIISETYLIIVGFGYISKRITKLDEIVFIPKVLILSAVMGVGLILLKGILSVWILIPLAVVFYGSGIIVWKEFRVHFETTV